MSVLVRSTPTSYALHTGRSADGLPSSQCHGARQPLLATKRRALVGESAHGSTLTTTSSGRKRGGRRLATAASIRPSTGHELRQRESRKVRSTTRRWSRRLTRRPVWSGRRGSGAARAPAAHRSCALSLGAAEIGLLCVRPELEATAIPTPIATPTSAARTSTTSRARSENRRVRIAPSSRPPQPPPGERPEAEHDHEQRERNDEGQDRSGGDVAHGDLL